MRVKLVYQNLHKKLSSRDILPHGRQILLSIQTRMLDSFSQITCFQALISAIFALKKQKSGQTNKEMPVPLAKDTSNSLEASNPVIFPLIYSTWHASELGIIIHYSFVMLDYPMSLILLSTWSIFFFWIGRRALQEPKILCLVYQSTSSWLKVMGWCQPQGQIPLFLLIVGTLFDLGNFLGTGAWTWA